LTMFVDATSTGFNISFGPTRKPALLYYRAELIAIVDGIKGECEMLGQRKRQDDDLPRSFLA
ncbi:hypothetical protein, partial [Tardiphaga sp. P5_C10]